MSVIVKPMPEYPADDATFEQRLAWMLLTHGFCKRLDRIVMLYEPSSECLVTRPAFTFDYKPWQETIPNPDGGKDITRFVAATWSARPERSKIRGIRMRPDRDYPTYIENSETFKNTYLKPVHKGAGDIQPFLDFIAHLLPTKFEREWFLDWLACKWMRPEIPGIAVVMVAQDVEGQIFGTGRGMLRDILQRLLGNAYAKHVDFDILTGKSAQGVYTDFLADVVLLMVDEAKDTADAARWAERRAAYERLKSVIDPRAIERSFVVKGGQRFFGLCFAAFLIFTNNLDAIQIPPGDRRFGCLANGGRMAAEMAKGLQAWMDQPGNIAALAAFLEARFKTMVFDPFEAPVTLTKSAMQELAGSERDDAFLAVRRRIGKNGLFTGEQFLSAMNAEVGSDTAHRDDFKFGVRQRLRAAATAIKRFRMPPTFSRTRAKILCWRDYNGPDAETLELIQAQEQVMLTGKVLAVGSDEQAEKLREGIFQVVPDNAAE
jgi:hypothetical protein